MAGHIERNYLEWPLYCGPLGIDSSGGTMLQTYASLCRKGILTTNSQDGFNTLLSKPLNCDYCEKRKLIGEEQRSDVCCIVPTELVERLNPIEGFHFFAVNESQEGNIECITWLICDTCGRHDYNAVHTDDMYDLEELINDPDTSPELRESLRNGKLTAFSVIAARSGTYPFTAAHALLDALDVMEPQ